ncbi:hypothetical protein AB0N07_47325 [Streptomyces sp. NPDC051172]|uniref:hypothetical protein n=1 Tax=Streptomyces sp. NPDC051172 TaxID=3155796 RepID=UPI0034487325
MKVQRADGAHSATTGRQLLLAEAVLAGAVALALLVREWPSIRRELRIYRMAGGFRAGRRYP